MGMTRDQIIDRLWVWGHDTGAHNDHYKLPEPSRMSAAEGAFYLGLHNITFITIKNKPEPPFDKLARSLAPLKRVVWSIVGDGGSDRTDTEEVAKLARKFPNITGAIMDDFFTAHEKDKRLARHTPDQIRGFRQRLAESGRPLDLWVAMYAHDLELPIKEHLSLIDVITFWHWKAEQLADIDRNVDRMIEITPGKKRILGCYLFDYGNDKPMPLDLMKKQTERGLQLMKEGKIDGMIFLATCICDLGLDTVEWTREWIKHVR